MCKVVRRIPKSWVMLNFESIILLFHKIKQASFPVLRHIPIPLLFLSHSKYDFPEICLFH